MRSAARLRRRSGSCCCSSPARSTPSRCTSPARRCCCSAPARAAWIGARRRGARASQRELDAPQRASRRSRWRCAIDAPRRPPAAAARLDRRAAAARARAASTPGRRSAARARRGHVRPPRPARARAARARAARPVRARPARRHAATTPTRCSCCRASTRCNVHGRRRRGATPAHARAALIAAAETEIDGLRPHREGSPASRIHWPALARGAGLMERKLISEADSRPLVVLDPRAPASQDALDAAVRAAALAGRALRRAAAAARCCCPGDRRAHVDRARPARPGRRRTCASRCSTTRTGPALARRAEPPRADRATSPPAPVDRPPRGLGRTPGGCLLVVPGALPDRRAVLEVAGCQGYVGGRTGGAAAMAAVAGARA